VPKLKFLWRKAFKNKYRIPDMQIKSQICWIIEIIGQYLCPKKTLSLIYLHIKALNTGIGYDKQNA
jgi:hypothetical protein